MLSMIRGSVAGWAAKILFGVLVASFAIWGVGDILRVKPESAVAQVGDREISGREFLLAFDAQVRQLQQRFGASFNREQARQFGIPEQTIRSMVATTIIDEAARDLELTASEAELLQQIRDNPNFKNSLGDFDRFRFEQVLQANNLSEQGFLALTRNDHVRRQLLDSLAGGLKSPKNIVEAFYKFQAEERKVETLAIPYASMSGVDKPTDGDISKYHDTNKKRFMAPEYRKVTYFTLQPEDLIADMVMADAVVKAEFKARRDEFTVVETRNVEQLLAGPKEKAEEALTLLTGGQDFYAVAAKIGGFKPDDVKLGRLQKSQLPEAVRDTVFKLERDKVSEPVEGPFGWVLYRVTEIKPGKEAVYAELKDKIARDLKLQKASEEIYDLSNKLEDSLAGGANLENTAKTFNLKVRTISAIDGGGLDPAGQKVKDLPTIPGFLAAIFRSITGAEPALEETESGAYYLIRIDQVTEPKLKSVASVRDEIVNAVTKERQAKAADKLAKELAGKARAGTTFAGLSKSNEQVVKISAFSNRSGMSDGADVGAGLVAALFDAGKSDVLTGIDKAGNSAVVARVVAVKAADPAKGKKQIASLETALSRSFRNGLIEQYRTALQKDYKVTYDQNAINALFDLLPGQ